LTISAVLFDFDDTLHDRAASLRAFVAYQHRRWFSDRISRERFVERFIALDANGHFSKSELYPCLIRELELDDIDAADLTAEYSRTYHEFAIPREDALATLAVLRERGLRLGVVSNGWTDFQIRTLRASGFSDAVDAVLISEQEGLRKPDHRLFERAADRLGMPKQDCLFVGDNPWADIDGARQAGMRTAWIEGGFGWPSDVQRADWDIFSLSELPSIIECHSTCLTDHS